MSAPELVFVYGTLRRGGSNHFRMAGATFHSVGTVKARLYHIDWFPGIVLGPGADAVIGEVFAVPPAVLGALDAFEGPEYRRVRVEVHGEATRMPEVWIWEWLGPVDESRRIPHGDWLAVRL